jgi:tetratricopeptide (TPR) repeat protein
MTLLRQLNKLESAGLVSIAQIEPDLEYLFRHAMVREAAYSSLLSVDAQQLHLAVGEAIEQLYPEKIDAYAAMLSYHFGEAGDSVKAQQYCVIAGKSALASFANQEAETHLCCALGLANQDAQHAEIIYLLGEARYSQSRYDEAIQTWQEGIELSKQLGDLSGVARFYSRSARAAWYKGDPPEGLRLSLEGLEVVKPLQVERSKAMLLHEAGRAYHFNGHPEEAEPYCRKALEMAEKLGAVDIQADALTTLGVLSNLSAEESLASLEKAVDLAETGGNIEIATRANHNLGVMTAEHLGDHKASRDHYLRAAELAGQRGAAHEEIFSLVGAAGVSLGMGDLKTGEKIVTRMDAIRSTLSDPSQVQFEYAGIEFGLNFLRGELQIALEIIRQVRANARERGDLQMLHNYCTSLVDVFLVLDYVDQVEDWQEAIEAAQEGIEISSRGVSSSIQSHSQLVTIYVRQGRRDEARQIFDQAQEKVGESPTFLQKQSLLVSEREIARVERNWEIALRAAERVSAQLAQTGMLWLWSYALVEWAETHLDRGEATDIEAARTLLREALAVFEKMESIFFVNLIDNRLRDLREKSIAMNVAHDKVTQELEEAGKIQGSFLPEEVPDIPGWEIAAVLRPAHETSGDFYDFLNLPGNKLGVVVADVADKGIGAALYMTTCRTLIRTFAGQYLDSPELVLANANQRILADTHGGLFITVFYGVLDTTSGEFKYCNAGHNSPFIFSAAGNEHRLELVRTGMPLGILAEGTWEQGAVRLHRGDLLIGYTDGITENQNEAGDFFGEQRLAESIEARNSLSAEELKDALLEEFDDFSGSSPRLDDMTLLVIKRN